MKAFGPSTKKLAYKWGDYIIVQRNACEADLEENHYLEQIGYTIWQTVIGDSHCPFCGTALEFENSLENAREAEYRHIDSPGWSNKVM